MVNFSFKNRMSVKNTAYIRLCTESDPRVRSLMLTVRYFAKHFSLAGGGGGSKITCYALTLIIITYLQQLPQPLLHSVYDLQQVENTPEDIISGWKCHFCPDLSQQKSLPQNQASVLQLLSGFFQFITDLDLSSVVLCPLLGRVINKSDLESVYPADVAVSSFLSSSSQDKLKLDSGLCVQDPFELSHNVCRNLPGRAVTNFKNHCAEAARVLQVKNCSIVSLFNIEVEPVTDERFNVSAVIGDLPPDQSQLFTHHCVVTVPSELFDWFQSRCAEQDNVLLMCGKNLVDTVFNECLLLDQDQDEENNLTKVDSKPISQKRSSSEVWSSESVAKKARVDKDSNYLQCSTWSMFNLVWPRRKQLALQMPKEENMTVVQHEAALTKAVVQVKFRINVPRLILKHY